MMKSTLLPSAALLALYSCAPVRTSPGVPGVDMVAGVLAGDLVDWNTYASKDPARISVPILHAPDLEAKHGKPDYIVMKDGSYAATHRLPGDRYFTIVGTPRPPRKFAYGPHGTLTLLGRKIGYQTTGNEDPEITSNATVFTAPDGRSATYVIIHGGRTDSVGGKSLSGNLPRLSW